MSFCNLNLDLEAPPSDPSYIANFIAELGFRSRRPKSIINGAVAALSAFYHAHNMTNVSAHPDITRLVTGITKGGTQQPRIPTPAMPIKLFKELFMSWPDNQDLELAKLRSKCVTCLALVMMLRPSDVAPKAAYLDSDYGVLKNVVFSTKDVTFMDNGCMRVVVIHGNKNDYDRDGFQVTVPPVSNPKLDPVKSLQCYSDRTECIKPVGDKPRFLSLKV